MSSVRGHGLQDEGAAFEDLGMVTPEERSDARMRRYGDEWFRRVAPNTVAGVGRGVCACGESSPVLNSAAARRRWHRDHKAEVLHGAEPPEAGEGRSRQVVGFLFDDTGDHVLLIRKNRPEWMKGRLCGVGGKVERDETKLAAMVREFQEETGVGTMVTDWVSAPEVLTSHGTDLGIFAARGSDLLAMATTTTDEELVVRNVSTLRNGEAIPNISFLVAMAWHSISYQELRGVIYEGEHR